MSDDLPTTDPTVIGDDDVLRWLRVRIQIAEAHRNGAAIWCTSDEKHRG